MTGKEKDIADSYGGSDKKDWAMYIMNDQRNGSLQPAHFERSAAHQPNHLKSERVKVLLKKL